MGLEDIASKIGETLDKVGEVAEEREARLVEHSAAKMAHNIVAYVLERAETGVDPFTLGQTMVQGAVIGEDESDGILAEPVLKFLESLYEGACSCLAERYGADCITDDPVAHAVQYMLLHNRWPDDVAPSVVARAKAALAAGQKGGGKGPVHGTFAG